MLITYPSADKFTNISFGMITIPLKNDKTFTSGKHFPLWKVL